MRILHINCNYLGTTLHQCMIEHLDKLGVDNTVYVPTYDANNSVIKPNANVCVSQCFNKWDRLCFDYKQRKIINDIQNRIDITKYDCIHAYTLFTDGNCAHFLSKKYNIPYVVAVRNTDVNAFFKYMIHLKSRGNKILQEASKVFFLSESYKKQVVSHYVKKELRDMVLNKIEVIPNGIDDFWFENLYFNRKVRNPNDNRIRLIYAGRIDKNKNITTTQKAVDLLRLEGYDATLTVIGKVADDSVYKIISNHKYTTVLPAMPKEKLIEQYREHDIFVMPSITESFGLVYAEALTQGLPVIYSKGQGFDQQFSEGFVGYHVDSRRDDDMVKKVKLVVKNYMDIQKNILSSVTGFSWAKLEEKYYQVYRMETERRKRGWRHV